MKHHINDKNRLWLLNFSQLKFFAWRCWFQPKTCNQEGKLLKVVILNSMTVQSFRFSKWRTISPFSSKNWHWAFEIRLKRILCLENWHRDDRADPSSHRNDQKFIKNGKKYRIDIHRGFGVSRCGSGQLLRRSSKSTRLYSCFEGWSQTGEAARSAIATPHLRQPANQAHFCKSQGERTSGCF